MTHALSKEKLEPSAPWWLDGRTLAMLSAAGFSLKAIFVKLAYAAYPVDALTLLTLRMSLALLAFLWLARSGGESTRLGRRDWVSFVLLGVTGYYLSSLLDFIGLQYISAGLERLILFTYPSLVLLLDSVWHRRPVTGRVWAAMAVAYIGLVAAFWNDLMHVKAAAAVLIGGAWVFASSLTFSAYYLGTGLVVGKVGATRMAGYSGVVASLCVIGHFLLARDPAVLTTLPPAVWGWSVAMALVSTVLPIWLMAKAVERLGAGRTAAIGTFGPVLTIVFGWFILSEPFSLLQLLGLVLVVGGVTGIGRARKS